MKVEPTVPHPPPSRPRKNRRRSGAFVPIDQGKGQPLHRARFSRFLCSVLAGRTQRHMSIDVIEWPRQRSSSSAGTNTFRGTTTIAGRHLLFSGWEGSALARVCSSIVGKRPRERNVGFTLTIRFFASMQGRRRPVCTLVAVDVARAEERLAWN